MEILVVVSYGHSHRIWCNLWLEWRYSQDNPEYTGILRRVQDSHMAAHDIPVIRSAAAALVTAGQWI